MIPGPVEFDPAVMAALGEPTTSHFSPEFIEVFGQALDRMCDVFLCPEGHPFVVAGSGTLAMDMAGANLIEPGDRALVVNTGYFSDRSGEILERYGAEVTHVRAPIGGRPALADVEDALKGSRFGLMTVTHVDTSTGVVADVEGLTALALQYETLIAVDGVCSVAGEELRMAEWGVDIAVTASQKAISVPPGLALLVAGPRAMEAFRRRKTPVGNYYADWANWLPVMEAYQARTPGYFGTPPVNLIYALNVSLGQILDEGMEARFKRHRAIGRACRRAMEALGLGQVPIKPEYAANTMTAPRYPAGVTEAMLLPRVMDAGAILAAGLHPAIKAEYFRIGHMGPTELGDLLATVGAVEIGLAECGYEFKLGSGVAAALSAY